MRRKIFIVVSLFLLVLFATGVGSIFLIRSTNKEYAIESSCLFDKTRAVQSLRYDNSSINSSYLPRIQSSTEGFPDDLTMDVFDSSSENIQKSLEIIAAELKPETQTKFDRLEAAVSTYLMEMEDLFASRPDSREERSRAAMNIAAASQQINANSEVLVVSLESSFNNNEKRLNQRVSQATVVIITILVSSLIVSWFLFRRAGQIIVDPVVDLTESIKQIQKGNYELRLPERRSTDELSALVPAFNEMATELRVSRKDSDNQLLRANTQNSAILASFPHPIILLDSAGSILKLNPEAEQLCEECHSLNTLPTKLHDLIQDAVASDTELLPERLDQALLIRRDETEFFYLPRLFRLTTPGGEVEGWVLLLTDVSRLRFFDDLKSNLISTVSHEIKTPLTGIRMVLQLLSEAKIGPLNATQEEMVSSANSDCERLLETLRNLLEMSRMDSGADSLQLEELAPETLLTEAVQTFRSHGLRKENHHRT